jgi:hypothetical protein
MVLLDDNSRRAVKAFKNSSMLILNAYKHWPIIIPPEEDNLNIK